MSPIYFFFTRLVLASGLHLWETYVGLIPSTALLPQRSCSPSTIHSLCSPHGLLFTSLFCYYNTWSAHTLAVKALAGHRCLILAERSDWMSEMAKNRLNLRRHNRSGLSQTWNGTRCRRRARIREHCLGEASGRSVCRQGEVKAWEIVPGWWMPLWRLAWVESHSDRSFFKFPNVF